MFFITYMLNARFFNNFEKVYNIKKNKKKNVPFTNDS